MIVANDDCKSQPGYGPFVSVNNTCISVTDVANAAYTCAVSTNNEFLLIGYQYIAPSYSFFNC
jgi:hypothetical protein